MKLKQLEQARSILRSNLQHTCDVYEFEEYKEGSITKSRRVLISKGIPCQLTQKSLLSADNQGSVTTYHTGSRLIICDNIALRPGNEFDVYFTTNLTDNQENAPITYIQGSDPFKYSTHQEISVIRKGRA